MCSRCERMERQLAELEQERDTARADRDLVVTATAKPLLAPPVTAGCFACGQPVGNDVVVVNGAEGRIYYHQGCAADFARGTARLLRGRLWSLQGEKR